MTAPPGPRSPRPRVRSPSDAHGARIRSSRPRLQERARGRRARHGRDRVRRPRSRSRDPDATGTAAHARPIEHLLDRRPASRTAGRSAGRSPLSTSSPIARSAAQPISGSGGASPRISRRLEWSATRPELAMNVSPVRSRTRSGRRRRTTPRDRVDDALVVGGVELAVERDDRDRDAARRPARPSSAVPSIGPPSGGRAVGQRAARVRMLPPPARGR